VTAVTAAFSAMLLSANLATPLYAVWARQFGFSTAVLALIFAVYALVLIPALLLFGQLSDRLGRRPVIGIGLGLAWHLRDRGQPPAMEDREKSLVPGHAASYGVERGTAGDVAGQRGRP
jgi:MFS family permease